jgi:hypothetical protein
MIDREELVKHVRDGLNMSQISRLYGITPTAVKKWLKKYDMYERKYAYNGHNDSEKKYHCQQCGVELTGSKRFEQKFCSHKCASKFQMNNQYETFIDRWKEGKEDGIKGVIATSNYIHRYIREQRGEKCWKCGWCEVNSHTGKIPLQLNHIDGNCQNNAEENLELLCPNCHSLTETFGRNNKQVGRRTIMKNLLESNKET